MKTLTKKQKEINGENFSRIVDDAAILLQRKADYVMNIKQVADYLGLSTDAVRKRCQPIIFQLDGDSDAILDREMLTKFA